MFILKIFTTAYGWPQGVSDWSSSHNGRTVLFDWLQSVGHNSSCWPAAERRSIKRSLFYGRGAWQVSRSFTVVGRGCAAKAGFPANAKNKERKGHKERKNRKLQPIGTELFSFLLNS